MGSINYSLTKRNTRVAMRNEDGSTVKVNGVIQYAIVPKWYAKAQMKEVIDTNTFMRYCVSHYGSVYGIVDLRACLEKISDCLIEQMYDGNKIDLEDLGAFKPNISSAGVEDATTFNSAIHIKKSYASWVKPKEMKTLAVDAFQHTSTVELRNAALRADALGKSQAGFATISLSVSTLDADGEIASGVNGGSVKGVGKFRIGDSTTIEAIANDGYTFVGWRLPGSNDNISTSASYEVTLTGNVNYVAVFQAEED